MLMLNHLYQDRHPTHVAILFLGLILGVCTGVWATNRLATPPCTCVAGP